MTELLYLKDSYLKEFEARVVKVDGKKVELNKTAFYPESGGQLSDRGKLLQGENEFKVVKARKEGKVVHQVDGEGLKEGERVKGVLDWGRRYKMMRMHTAAHIITSAVQSIKPDALVTGGQLKLDESRDDYSLDELSEEMVKEIEGKANEIVEKGLDVKVYELPREEAFKKPQLFKLKDVLPPNIPKIRIVQIADDLNACGGTHVKNTGEVGKIKITRTKSKGSNNKRIYFTVED